MSWSRAISTAAVGTALAGLVAAGPPSSFQGTWHGTDSVDRSTVRVSIGGGANPSVTLTDDDATGACDTGGHATARGHGTVDGNNLHVAEFLVRCADGTEPFTTPITFIYDPDTDTLTDDISCGDVACTVLRRPGR